MAEILIAEDETNVREGLIDLFTGSGYAVRAAADGAAALNACAKRVPDLLLLDVMMPKKDGLAVLADVRRRWPRLPVILLTAKSEVSDKVEGLGLGADDYVTKPFDVGELLARVSRAIRRDAVYAAIADARENAPAPTGSFAFAGATVDQGRMQLVGLFRDPVPLSPREVNILRLFALHPNEALGREHLLGTLWGLSSFGTTRTLDQHVAQLRRKLGRRAGCLETVVGVGYRYVPPKE